MAKVEIDTNGVTIRIEDADVGSDVLGPRALALYREAVAVDAVLPTGPASGGQLERRASSNLGFGTWRHQAKPPDGSQ